MSDSADTEEHQCWSEMLRLSDRDQQRLEFSHWFHEQLIGSSGIPLSVLLEGESGMIPAPQEIMLALSLEEWRALADRLSVSDLNTCFEAFRLIIAHALRDQDADRATEADERLAIVEQELKRRADNWQKES